MKWNQLNIGLRLAPGSGRKNAIIGWNVTVDKNVNWEVFACNLVATPLFDFL